LALRSASLCVLALRSAVKAAACRNGIPAADWRGSTVEAAADLGQRPEQKTAPYQPILAHRPHQTQRHAKPSTSPLSDIPSTPSIPLPEWDLRLLTHTTSFLKTICSPPSRPLDCLDYALVSSSSLAQARRLLDAAACPVLTNHLVRPDSGSPLFVGSCTLHPFVAESYRLRKLALFSIGEDSSSQICTRIPACVDARKQLIAPAVTRFEKPQQNEANSDTSHAICTQQPPAV
jgi:hypothetical protein